MPDTFTQDAAAEAEIRAARTIVSDPGGFRGDYLGHARAVVDVIARGRSAEWLKELCLRVAGVRARGRREAVRELVGWITERPRMADSQRV